MKKFKLEIITPERLFFSGMVDFVTVPSIEGQMTVLQGHAAMIAVIETGKIEISIDGEKSPAFVAAGFMEVRPKETLIFAQKCEWPHEIDENRAKADEEEAKRALMEKQSHVDYLESKNMLKRAMVRLKVKNRK